jgi:RNA polymerase sigma-70 factor (ECF subfamily)
LLNPRLGGERTIKPVPPDSKKAKRSMSGLGYPSIQQRERFAAAANPTPEADEPRQLVSGVPEAAGVARSFESFFEAESTTLFRRLWLVTGNKAEAEEIMQDAFLKLWERWDRVQQVDDLAGYLYRTAMNVFRRRYQRAAMAMKRTVGVGPGVDEFALADERQVIRKALAGLSPRQRAALVLTEMLGFSANEAARALGVRASTVRALAFQGRAALKKSMETIDE